MNKLLLSSCILAASLGAHHTAHADMQWQMTKGKLMLSQQLIDWQSTSLGPCANCTIQQHSSDTAGNSYHLYEGETLRAIRVDNSQSWIDVPLNNTSKQLSLSHNRDGSLMLHTPEGKMHHIKLHQANLITIDGQSFHLWLDGYNPASRNWQYDDAHDQPQISYTLLAL
ncbi:hypothetical protein [Shewanella sp. GXUN23E]|uniref:hypothetical protein n=1 Tax=Shewanella sp. GXUN23E TaxID=3422498 RepID=UPI003D7DAE77